jgi:isopenicillin N synthase-like dioxygenase
MNLGGFLDRKAQQPLPPAFINHEPELYAFQKSCQTLMNKILDLFAVGLEVLSQSSFCLPILLSQC